MAEPLPSAPTTFTLNSSVYRLGREIQFSWNGAKVGSSKQRIIGYRIYWKISSQGTPPSQTDYTSWTSISIAASSGSATVVPFSTLPTSHTIDEKIAFGISTVTAIEGSDDHLYSSVKSASAINLWEPTITSVSYVNGKTYSALHQIDNYMYSLQPKISTNTTGTIECTIELEGNTTTYLLPNQTISSTTNIILKTCNIFTVAQAIGFKDISPSGSAHWYVSLRLWDGYAWSPTAQITGSIAHMPYFNGSNSYLVYYNQFADSNVTGTSSLHIGRRLRVKYAEDTSISKIAVQASQNGTAVTTSFTTSTYTQDETHIWRYVDITFPDTLDSAQPVEVIVNLTTKEGGLTRPISKITVTAVKKPLMKNPHYGAPTIKPFTDTGAFEITAAWPFGTATTISAGLSQCDCSSTVSNAIKLEFAGNTSTSNPKVISASWSKSSDNIRTTLNRQNIYGFNNEFGYTTYVGKKDYYWRIRIINLFGQEFTTGWQKVVFDFDTLATTPTISSVEWATTNSTIDTDWTTFTTGTSSSSDQAQESLYLRFHINFGLYTEDKVTVRLRLTNDSGTATVVEHTYNTSELQYATDRTAVSNTVTLVYGPIGPISTTRNRSWIAQVQNNAGTVSSTSIITRARAQKAPNTVLTVCTSTDNYQISYTFTQSDLGGATSVVNYLSDGTQNLSTQLPNKSGTVQSLVTGWDAISICIKTTSTVVGLITRTVDYYSNHIIVYRTLPTVAYRKNQIGINTKTPISSAVVDINQATGKDSVIINGIDANGVAMKFDINVANGTINLYYNGSLVHKLDMLNGSLS